MKIAQVLKKDEVPMKHGNKDYGKTRLLVEEFIASGAEAVEVDGEGKPAMALHHGLYSWVRNNRDQYPVEVRKKGDKVYLVRADEVKE